MDSWTIYKLFTSVLLHFNEMFTQGVVMGEEQSRSLELWNAAAGQQVAQQVFPLPVAPQVEPAQQQVHPLLEELGQRSGTGSAGNNRKLADQQLSLLAADSANVVSFNIKK